LPPDIAMRLVGAIELAATRQRKRASNGAGSVSYDQATGRWRAQISVKNLETGRSQRKTLYAKTEREARERLAEVRINASKGLVNLTPGKTPTLQQYSEYWLDSLTVRTTTINTYRIYLSMAYPVIGHLQLSRIMPSHILQLIRTKQNQGLQPRSCNHLRNVLVTLFNQAMRDGIIFRNAPSLVRSLPVRDKEMKILEKAQLPSFLELAKSYHEGNLWIIGLDTGARLSELQGLRWSDVDLETGRVSFRRTLQPTKKVKGWEWRVYQTKTQKSDRSIYLSPKGIEALKEQRVMQALMRAMNPTWNTEFGELVFTDACGNPEWRWNTVRRFQAALKRAGLPRIRFHDLRHSSATFLFSQGVPAFVVADRLGHSRVGITLDLYRHKVDAEQRAASSAMGSLLGGAR
jgi:integrase